MGEVIKILLSALTGWTLGAVLLILLVLLVLPNVKEFFTLWDVVRGEKRALEVRMLHLQAAKLELDIKALPGGEGRLAELSPPAPPPPRQGSRLERSIERASLQVLLYGREEVEASLRRAQRRVFALGCVSLLFSVFVTGTTVLTPGMSDPLREFFREGVPPPPLAMAQLNGCLMALNSIAFFFLARYERSILKGVQANSALRKGCPHCGSELEVPPISGSSSAPMHGPLPPPAAPTFHWRRSPSGDPGRT